jgi:hypothetical protein
MVSALGFQIMVLPPLPFFRAAVGHVWIYIHHYRPKRRLNQMGESRNFANKYALKNTEFFSALGVALA